MSVYPKLQDIVDLGYRPEAAANVLRAIKENGGDPIIYWKSLKDGDRDARPPYGWVNDI